MQREIKFRAWDKELLEMIPPKKIMCGQLGMLIDTDKEWTDVSYSMDRFNVMQYTGLKDKNGKEIYEGDLLNDSNGYIWLVSWNDNHGCYQVTNDNIVVEIIDNDNEVVVGNIYSNPELVTRAAGV